MCATSIWESLLRSAERGRGARATRVCRYFCSVAGVGLDAEVARRANELPRWLRGHGGYALSLAPTHLSFCSAADEDSRRQTKPVAGLLAAISRRSWRLSPTLPTYGGGMKIAPQARMDDGQLDVCVIGGVDPFKLACMFPTVYFGRHLGIREVEYFQTARLRVETETPLDVYADGEYVCRTPVEVAVRSGALKVITP